MSFKKIIVRSILVILVGGLSYGIYYASQAFPILAGYGAKNLCSCVTLGGRQPADVIKQELGGGILALGSFEFHAEDSSATGSVFGFAKRKAVYRKGLGCTLLSEIEEQELRDQKFITATSPSVNQDSISWPSGNLVTDTLIIGIDYDKINKTLEAAFSEPGEEKNRRTRAMLIVYNGQIIAERYADGFTRDSRLLGWSMTKSLTNALMGLLVKEEKISLNDKAPIDEWESDERSAITINNLMQASSGLAWKEIYSGPSDATKMLFRKRDAGIFASHAPAAKQPDTDFYYSSGTTNILSWIIRNKVGDADYHRFPYKNLFYKIGMNSMIMEPDAGGTFIGSSFSYATARDWARFGLLYLNDGMWGNERILPEGWVEYTSTPAKGAEMGEYGAQFWLNAGAPGNPEKRMYPAAPADLFWADGYEGQNVFILPSKNLVIVKLSLSSGNYLDDNQFLADIISALP
jgi:CubicO group peptidase (beta-lactamase class C family)